MSKSWSFQICSRAQSDRLQQGDERLGSHKEKGGKVPHASHTGSGAMHSASILVRLYAVLVLRMHVLAYS